MDDRPIRECLDEILRRLTHIEGMLEAYGSEHMSGAQDPLETSHQRFLAKLERR